MDSAIILVVSDLHLGKGRFLENGQLNIMEDFEEDDRFAEFLDYYSSGEYESQCVHLVLNGDIFNLIQIDIDGVFSSIITEEVTIKALGKIIQGHPTFFTGIQRFLGCPHKKVSYVIGNHDAGMNWEGPQKLFRDRVKGSIDFTLFLELSGVHIEHGHRFEAINSVPASKYFLPGPNEETVLNLPWGSHFCIDLLPRLKKERPYIDKVRPMSAYMKWCFFHDMYYFFCVNFYILKFLWNMYFASDYGVKWSWWGPLPMLKQLTLYPNYEKQAKHILRKNSDIHTVIMGHTHLREWRKFPHNRYYFNTGTWNHIPSMDSSMHQNETNLTYVSLKIDLQREHVLSASMNSWQGKWRPYLENITLEGVSERAKAS
jgi:UDP-2,3-diacylglucosamine pyrophosphatase LpxH